MNGAPREPGWKKTIRVLCFTAFALVFATTLAMLYTFQAAFRSGAPAPTATKTHALINHGEVVYITSAEKQFADLLFDIAFAAIPALIVAGFVIHFLMRVKLFGGRAR